MTHLEYSLGKDGGGIPKETIRKRERDRQREHFDKLYVCLNCKSWVDQTINFL